MIAVFCGVALYFSLHTLMLTLLPMVNELRVGGSAEVSALLLIAYMGSAALADIPAGAAAARLGLRGTVLIGSALATAGTVLLMIAQGEALAFSGAIIVGVSTAFLMGPLLSAFATLAGSSQVRAQLLSAAIQRGGGLLTSLVVATVLASGRVEFAAVSAIVLAIVIGVMGAALAGRRAIRAVSGSPVEHPGSPPAPKASEGSPRVLASVQVQLGLIVGLLIPLLLVFAGSYFPMAVLNDQGFASETGAAALVAREVVAIVAALVLAPFAGRLNLTASLIWSTVIGVAGLFAAVFVTDSIAFVVLFALHGVTVSVAIMATNVHLYLGTDLENRHRAFAFGAIISRVSSMAYPLILIHAVSGVSQLLMVVAIIGAVLAALYIVNVPRLRGRG